MYAWHYLIACIDQLWPSLWYLRRLFPCLLWWSHGQQKLIPLCWRRSSFLRRSHQPSNQLSNQPEEISPTRRTLMFLIPASLTILWVWISSFSCSFAYTSQVIEADEGCSYLFRPRINLFHFPPRNFQNLRRQPIFFPQRRRARSRGVAGCLAAVIWHFNYSWVFFCWSIENLWRFEIFHLGLLFPAVLLLCTALCFRHLGWSTVSDCGFFARKITPYPAALQFLGIFWRNERAHLSCHGWASRDVYFKGTQILFLFSSI